ncbi:hypothetical protein N7563_22035 [Leclercia adecarboxylata ATCC 23216 = NBRC 102595]|nr:hypothetical protein [Leclercia adecarboxylata ATCC 23216 = NBRC 102595]
MLKFCPRCGKASASASFKQNHFDNCVKHPDPAIRQKAMLRRNALLTACNRCGYASSPPVIQSHHNEKCKAVPLVAVNAQTGETRFYRWSWMTVEDGFERDAIRQILRGARHTTGGFHFREASQEEVAAGAVLNPTVSAAYRPRERAVVRIADDGTETHFPSIREAATATPGASPGKICEVMSGDRKKHAGFNWRFNPPKL